MTILIPTGVTSQQKTPKFLSEVLYGQSARTAGDAVRAVLLVGYKAASGSTLGTNEIFPITNGDEAIAAAGYGSELAGMIEASEIEGATRYGLALTDPGGDAATLTITCTAGTGGGSVLLEIDESSAVISHNTGDTDTTFGDRVVEVMSGFPNICCAFVNAAGTITATVRNSGQRGNEHFGRVDTSKLPTGANVVLTGGTALANGAVPFTGGTGLETYATILAETLDVRFDYTAWAANDAVSVPLICTQGFTKAGPFGAGPENMVFCGTGTASAAIAVSQAANQVLGSYYHYEGRMHGSKVAAAAATLRSVLEANPRTQWGDPTVSLNYRQLPNIPPHWKPEHSPGNAETNLMLNAGVTPIASKDGYAAIVRSITMRSLSGANPDYRALDTAAAVTPQRIRESIHLLWDDEIAPNNPAVAPDPPDGELPPDGVMTPRLWSARINSLLSDAEDARLLTETDTRLARVEFNEQIEGLAADIPTKVQRNNAVGTAVIRQV